MATTEMACDPALMRQDTWVGAFIGGANVTLTGDTLTLGHGDVTVTLMDREVADPDRPLEGTRWVVDGIVAGDAVLSIPAGVTAALTKKACAPEAMAVEQAVTAVLSGQVGYSIEADVLTLTASGAGLMLRALS